MERLLMNGVEEFTLREQYRMPSPLLRHPNNYFYDSVVTCARSEADEPDPPLGFPWPNAKEPLAFVEIGNDSEIVHNFGGRSNPSEVDIILEIVERVVRAGEIETQNLSIISPYSKQVQLIKTHLANASLLSRHDYSGVRVGTGEMPS